MDFYAEIKKRYGNIRRTRGFYLYTEKNVRILDLYLDNGMAIFGRKDNQIGLTVKQFTDRGLFTFLPSTADTNLQKALNILFPEYEVRFFSDYTKILEDLKIQNTQADIEKMLWRPFSEENQNLENKNLFFIQPPFCSTLKIAAFKKSYFKTVPENCQITAVEKAALAKAFFELIRKTELLKKQDDKSNEQVLPAKIKNRKKQISKNYAEVIKLCSSVWEVKDRYLFPKIYEKNYNAFFENALNSRILISPNFDTPSILPELNTYAELISFLKLYNKTL